MTWETLPMKELGTWYGGGTPSKANEAFWADGDIPWLSPKDMGAEVMAGTQDHITQAAVYGSSTKLVPAGSVAIVTRSGILERRLPVALVPFATTLNQDMKALVPREGIDPRWIAWGLRAFEHTLLRQTRKGGTTVASIEWPRFQAFRLPIPTLSEQHRIVEILEENLSRLDAAELGVRRAGLRLRSLDRSALEACFGAKDDGVPLKDLVAGISAGKSFGGVNAPARDDEWGIIKVSAMTWGEFRPGENKAVTGDRVDPRYEIHEGDLLVSRANTSEYVGASVLVGPVRQRLLLSDKSLRVEPRPGVSAAWLWRALQAPSARAQISALATGTKDSMRNISQGALLSVRVPAAETAAQEAALRRFDGITSACVPTSSALANTTRRSLALRHAVLAAAFSGQLAT